MGRLTAASDRDYYDEIEHRVAPLTYCVSCVACSRDFYVRADEKSPFRCDDCLERDAAVAEAAR